MSIKKIQKLIGLIINQYILNSNYQTMHLAFVSLIKKTSNVRDPQLCFF